MTDLAKIGPAFAYAGAADSISAINDPTGEIARGRNAAPPSALNRAGVVRFLPIPLLVRDMYGMPPLGPVQSLAPGARLLRVELTERGGWLCAEFPGLKPGNNFDAKVQRILYPREGYEGDEGAYP